MDKFKKSFDEVLIITQEELNNDTIKTVKKVYSFLDVEEIIPENADQRYNAGGIYKDNFITNLLLKQSVFRSTLKKLIPITPKMKGYKEKMIAKYKTKAPAISEEAENYLVESLKEDVLKLNQVYNVNISNWNNKFKKQSTKIYN